MKSFNEEDWDFIGGGSGGVDDYEPLSEITGP